MIPFVQMADMDKAVIVTTNVVIRITKTDSPAKILCCCKMSIVLYVLLTYTGHSDYPAQSEKQHNTPDVQ